MNPTLPPPPGLLALPDNTVGTGDKRTRMTSATECRRMVTQLIREDVDGGRALSRLVAKKCYDGNAPYKKKPAGHGWTANINFLGMEGLISAARVPYYALWSGAPTYATFCTSFRRDDPESERWNSVVADCYTKLLNRWKPYRWHNRAREFEMLFEGFGVKFREDPTDWRFKTIPSRSVYVPVESPSWLDERIPFIAIKREYRVHELYNKIADEQAARDRGWNVEQVKWAITNACNRNGADTNWRNQNYEYWQERLKNHEITTSYTGADIIRTAHVFVQEFAEGSNPGKVSQFVVCEMYGGPDSGYAKANPEPDGYLFAHPNAYDRYSQVVIPAFQDTGDGSWHSVRGLAYKSFRHVELQNRLLCRAVDNAFLAAGPIIQQGDSQSKDATQMAVIGPITVLSKNTNFVDHRLGCDMQNVLAVNRVLENNLAQNIGQFNQRSLSREDGRGEQPTATQVELQAGKESSLTQAQIDSYYDDLDTEHEEMYAVVIKGYDAESRRFIRECLDQGVPREALDQMYEIKANRLSGYPSPELRKRRLLEFGQLFLAMLPEDGKDAFLDEVILAFFGPSKLNVLNPKQAKPDLGSAWAKIENGVMEEGIVPEIISGMSDVEHLQIHIAYAKKKMEPLDAAIQAEQPIPPEEMEDAVEFTRAFGPHAEMHLGRIEGDPSRKDLEKLFRDEIEYIFGVQKKLRIAIKQAQREAEIAAQQEAQATALDAKTQAELRSSAIHDQIDTQKAVADGQRKDWKAQQTQRLKDEQAAAAMRRDAVTTLHSMSMETLEAQNKAKNNERNGK